MNPTTTPSARTQDLGEILSVQLWSLHQELFGDLGWEATVGRVAEAGFRHVEPFAIAQTKDTLVPLLERHGLTTPTGHGELSTPQQRDETVAAAVALGLRLLMQPMIPAERWTSLDGVRGIADDLNAAAELAAPHGIRIAFHNHDDEVRTQLEGRPALVTLFDHVGPDVGVEFDPNWATIGGADPLTLIHQLRHHPGGDRIFALHLKDGPIGGGNADQVAVGDGDLPWTEILAAVPGVPRVIGLDLFAGDSLDAVIRSFQWVIAHQQGGLSR